MLVVPYLQVGAAPIDATKAAPWIRYTWLGTHRSLKKSKKPMTDDAVSQKSSFMDCRWSGEAEHHLAILTCQTSATRKRDSGYILPNKWLLASRSTHFIIRFDLLSYYCSLYSLYNDGMFQGCFRYVLMCSEEIMNIPCSLFLV